MKFSPGTIAEVTKNRNTKRLASVWECWMITREGPTSNPNRGTSLCKGPEAREDIVILGELHIECLDMVGT